MAKDKNSDFVPLPDPFNQDDAPIDEGGDITPVDPDGTVHAEYTPPGHASKLDSAGADRAIKASEYQDASKLGKAGIIAKDVGRGVGRGAIKAGENTVKFFGSVLEGMDDSDTYSTLEGAPPGGMKPDPVSQAVYDGLTNVDIPKPEAPHTTAGQLSEGVSQFIVEMAGVNKFFKAANWMQQGGKLMMGARAAVEGGTAQAVGFDPNEERLSNFLEDHPSLANPISDYLAAKPEDSAAEGRLKNFLEGTMGGAAVEGLIALVRGVRGIRSAKTPEAAEKATQALGEELQAHVEGKPEVAPVAPEVVPEKRGGPNVEPPSQNIKDYMIERLEHGIESDPGVSRDFNLSKQATTDGAKEVINLMSDAIAPEIDKLKGGAQTFETIQRLADIAGEKPAALLARMSVRAKDAKRMASDAVATEQLMLSLARQISDEARRVDSGLKNPEYLNALQNQLSSVVADLKATKTAAARTTAAGRMIKTESLSPSEVKALVAAGGDLGQVTKIIKPKSIGRKILEAHNELWINALLSGPKTHAVNITSNILNTIARPVEMAWGGNIKDGLSEAMGMVKGIKDSVSLAAKAFRLEESILAPMANKVEGGRGAISAQRFGMNPDSYMGTALDWMGKAVRLPTRFLLSADEMFKQLNYRSNVYATAVREGVAQGFDNAALAKYVEERFASAFDGTGKGLDEGAMHEAELATFTNDLIPGSIPAKVAEGVNAHPILRLILPFIKTPTNIVVAVGQRTPGLNLLLKSYREELKAGGIRAAQARGKWATGGLLWTSGLMLAAQGTLTGKGPSDPNERAAKLATGWRPYSVKVGNEYVDYSRLDPFGMALGLSADFVEAWGHMGEKDKTSVAAAMGMALASNLSSKTYLRGMTEALDAFNQPDRFMRRFLLNRVGSYIPSAAQQVAGLAGGDRTMREVRTFMDAIYARTPGLSETLAPKRNYLGEPIKYPEGLGPDSISPIATSTDLHDSVKDELSRLSFGIKQPSETVNKGRIDLTKYKNAKGQDAYDRMMELRLTERKHGKTLKEKLQAEIQSDRYKALPDGNEEYSSKKLDRIRTILGDYQERCFKVVCKEFPQLDKDIKIDDHNATRVKRKGVSGIQELLNQ